MIRLAVFDLDGTLAESKSAVDAEMVALLGALLAVVEVAVISGGDWPQFERQLLENMPHHHDLHDRLQRLSLLPTCGTKFYRHRGDWELVYSEDLTTDERAKIVGALELAAAAPALVPTRVWGDVIEDRGSQITFSALGQEAPLAAKRDWDPDFAKRTGMTAVLSRSIPEFSVRMGGTTSIDVTRPGVDKDYGIQRLRAILGVHLSEMIFVGDALMPGGNDAPVREAGVTSIEVRDPTECKRVIQTMTSCLARPARGSPS